MARSASKSSVFEDVLEGLHEGVAWARGEKVLRVTKAEMPEPPPIYTADQIRAIRLSSGMSQGLFSRYLSISSKTLQAWEQGVRRPSRLSARFLQLIELEPNLLRRLREEPGR